MRVASSDNLVEGNRLVNTAGSTDAGISVTGERCTVSANLIEGAYARGLVISGIGSATSAMP